MVNQYTWKGDRIMSHGPATEWKEDNCTEEKSKLGIKMFIAYTIVYFGFIFINVFNPQLMRMDIGSINLAIAYGFFLIISAIILALIYNYQCNKLEKESK